MSKAKQVAVAVGTGLALVGGSAMAQVDVTAVTTGISDAQTAILSVLGGLLGLSVAVFGLAKVYSFIKRRAGA
jgi:hypothetical protein